VSVEHVWVVAEPAGEGLSATSRELISQGRRVGDRVTALTWGRHGERSAEVAGALGATRLVDFGDLGTVIPASVIAASLAALVPSEAPDAILIPASPDGRDIAGRLSVMLDVPVLTNVTGLREGDGLLSEHPVFGGTQTVVARVRDATPALFVVRAKSFVAEVVASTPAPRDALVAATSVTPPATIRHSHVQERSGPALDDAAVVVSGGRGLGDVASYALVEELARLLHGAPGASRAIVDAGWVPYSHQVGQTGKTVKPDLYIACGISGATQHMVGMKGAAHIVAINKDPDAPIFAVSDLGVVGDVHTILPALIAALSARGDS